MDTTSYWKDSSKLPRFPKVDKDYQVDVAIIGAGITGITSAYLLKEAGFKVALIERGRCGGFDTSSTTAHLTCVTDTRLHKLVSKFGKKTAKAVWESGRAALDQIFNLIESEEIDCDFSWNPAFLYAATNSKSELTLLRKDAVLARELGFSAQFLNAIPLTEKPGVKFSHQARFHPLKYLAALINTIPGKGSHVFEHSDVEEVQDSPLRLKIGKHQIRFSRLVLATHTPLTGKSSVLSAALFQSKLFLYTSYAIGAKVASGSVPPASYYDTASPYHYLRIDHRRGFDYVILGGEDHKTGQINATSQPYARLEEYLRRLFPHATVDHSWSGQVIETPDGLPYIGETAPRQFASTGFSGNGMTFGTLAAMMARDVFCGEKNPWKSLFDPHRKSVSGTWEYLKENFDYPYYMLRDWVGRGESKSLKCLRRNEGAILRLKGKKVAAYRNEDGKVTLCSPVCTHLQCIVGWNKAERTWDCPCHGSRFAATGEVLSGPAEAPLERINPDEE